MNALQNLLNIEWQQLNDATEPEIDLQLKAPASTIASCFVGGRSDNDSNWEGRIDEVVVHDGTQD